MKRSQGYHRKIEEAVLSDIIPSAEQWRLIVAISLKRLISYRYEFRPSPILTLGTVTEKKV